MKAKQVILMIALAVGIYACGSKDNNGKNGHKSNKHNVDNAAAADTTPPKKPSYTEMIQAVKDTERLKPANFLNVKGDFTHAIFGKKLKVQGKIKSTAMVAIYKDAVVKITFLSKTRTVLGTKNYTVNETIEPYSEKEFDFKTDDNYEGVESISLNVISAVPN
jgi:hypothetical protein